MQSFNYIFLFKFFLVPQPTRLWQYYSQQYIRANVYDFLRSSRYVKVFFLIQSMAWSAE